MKVDYDGKEWEVLDVLNEGTDDAEYVIFNEDGGTLTVPENELIIID